MAGFCGLFSVDGTPVSRDRVAAMAGCMPWRGEVASIERGTAIMSQLSVTGASPCEIGERLVVIGDARLAYRAELARALDVPGHDFSDLGLVAEAWARWGDASLSRIDGDFAFCVWAPEARTLCCVRDRWGARPLHYAMEGHTVVVASEAGAVVAGLSGRPPPDTDRINDYLLGYETLDRVSTFHKGVSRLVPGTFLRVAADSNRVEQYWQMSSEVATQSLSFEAAQEGLRERLVAAIADRLDSCERPGCLVSGGIDSLAIHRLAPNADALLALSAVSDQADGDTESIGRYNALFPHEALELCADDMLGQYAPDDLFASLDSPFGGAMTMIASLYKQARTHGVSVVADGIDGDVVMSLPDSRSLALLRAGAAGDALREIAAARPGMNGFRRLPVVARRAIAAGAPSLLRDPILSWRLRGGVEESLSRSMLTNQARRSGEVLDRYLRFEVHRLRRPTGIAALYADWLNRPILQTGLERYEQISARAGVEAVHPLVDRQLIEFCAGLPWHYRALGSARKRVLRHMMAAQLPDALCFRRDKPHLGWWFTSVWLNARWPAIREFALDNIALAEGLVDTERVVGLFQPASYDTEEGSLEPMRLYHLLAWLSGQQH